VVERRLARAGNQRECDVVVGGGDLRMRTAGAWGALVAILALAACTTTRSRDADALATLVETDRGDFLLVVRSTSERDSSVTLPSAATWRVEAVFTVANNGDGRVVIFDQARVVATLHSRRDVAWVGVFEQRWTVMSTTAWGAAVAP
jgi:hypothetical protein